MSKTPSRLSQFGETLIVIADGEEVQAESTEVLHRALQSL